MSIIKRYVDWRCYYPEQRTIVFLDTRNDTLIYLGCKQMPLDGNGTNIPDTIRLLARLLDFLGRLETLKMIMQPNHRVPAIGIC